MKSPQPTQKYLEPLFHFKLSMEASWSLYEDIKAMEELLRLRETNGGIINDNEVGIFTSLIKTLLLTLEVSECIIIGYASKHDSAWKEGRKKYTFLYAKAKQLREKYRHGPQ